MQFLNNWRLRTRVLAGFTVVIALLVGASMIGVMRIAQLNDRIDQMVDVDMHALELSRQWAGLTEISIQRRIVDLAVDDPTFVKAFTRKSKETSARIDKVQEELKKLEKSPEAARLTETIGAQRKAYQMLRDDVTKQKKDGENVQSRVVNELIPAMEAYLDAINAFAENSHTELQAAKQTAQEQEQATRKLVLGLLAISTALGIGVALVITNSVTGPLGEARTLAMAIAEGNLSTRVVTNGRDEVAELNRTLDHMQTKLAGTIQGVRRAAEQVRLASGEIASGNQDLSNRTEQAASSLEETGAAMQQLSEGVRENANAAKQADGLAKAAADVAGQGGEMVEKVIQTMAEIQQSSSRIGDIIGTIDGIAFQTNILALNAAVEAARAGEQGRGFAVVASEVRALALRSTEAAREIKTLISNSRGHVEEGNRLVTDTGNKMQEIVGSVQRVNHIIGNISTSSASQALTLGEIGQAVGQLDQMTQQNAALVEESAAAAQGLKEQAVELVDVVASFQLGH